MRVRVRLFAQLRERAGRGELELELPEGARVADALAALEPVAAGLPLVLAVNRDYARPEDPLAAGDELAAVPPVSGGDGGGVVEITGDPLSLDALRAAVRDPRAGAVVIFEGVTREVDRLDYEAYEPMARERIARIVDEVLGQGGACRAAVAHRVGAVPLSEPSVLVAVSAPHRSEAFAAARELIDRVKAEAPIWKKEPEGWVEGTTPPAR